MNDAASVAKIASLLGDPARANMMTALMDGRALTAKELAYAAHVSPQTASGHLAQLTEACLLGVERQGRNRYHRIASPLIGRMIEGILAVAGTTPEPRRTTWRGGEALRTARTCYDHLAGRLGVAIADALQAREHVRLDADGGELTQEGQALFADIGIAPRMRAGRVYCRPCLDWSERRPHIAGALGAALASRCFELGWIKPMRDTRAVAITTAGRTGFAEAFGVRL